MPDCVLPSRNEVQRSDLDIAEPAFSIVAAYLDDELKTEPEWREAIDYEAAARWTHAEMVRRGPTDLTWESAYTEEQVDHLFLAFGAIGAALGDAKTTEELHTAAFDAALPDVDI